jgi:hypothetical protein
VSIPGHWCHIAYLGIDTSRFITNLVPVRSLLKTIETLRHLNLTNMDVTQTSACNNEMTDKLQSSNN